MGQHTEERMRGGAVPPMTANPSAPVASDLFRGFLEKQNFPNAAFASIQPRGLWKFSGGTI